MTLTLSHPQQGEAGTVDQALLGEKIGNIRLVEVLGSGGMGTVYAGVDERLERRVAVKAIRHDRRLDTETKARFLREARVLSKLDHPNICHIFDYLEHDEHGHFLVLELVRGKTLDEIPAAELNRLGTMRIALQIADVLVAAHDRGVVHRDLKPNNLMVTDSGAVKVLDFGLSRVVDEQQETATTVTDGPEDVGGPAPPAGDPDQSFVRTRLGAVMGTVSYMSPEQAQGQAAGPASDMYSFGLVLQELFTGQPPYDPSASPAQRLAWAKQAQTRPVSGIDPDLTTLINRLKSLNPGTRPSAQDAAEQLRQVRDKPKRRLKRLVTGAVMAILTLLSVGLAIQSRRIAAERDRAEAETSKAVAINRFMQEVLSSAEPNRGVKRDVTIMEALDRAEALIDVELAAQPAIAAEVRNTFGRTYTGLGEYEKAERLITAALQQRQRLYGQEHPEVALSLHSLAWLRLRLGKLDEAEELLSRSLAMGRRLLGTQHERVVETMLDLGNALSTKGEYDRAEALQREALELTRTLHPDKPDKIGAALNDLAWTLSNKGELGEAEELFRQALALRRQGLGEEHPFVALTMNNLAGVLMRNDRLDEAEELVRAGLEIRRKTLGERHSRVAESQYLLASLLRRRGELDEAEQLYRQAIAINREALGPVHSNVATNLDQLAGVLSGKGDLDGAERCLRQALGIHRQLGSQAQPVALATTTQNLAWTLVRKGSLDEAEQLYRESLAILLKVYRPDNWMVANTQANLGSCLTKLGQYDEAQQLLASALTVMVATFGEDHSRSQKVQRFLDELAAERRRSPPRSHAAS